MSKLTSQSEQDDNENLKNTYTVYDVFSEEMSQLTSQCKLDDNENKKNYECVL